MKSKASVLVLAASLAGPARAAFDGSALGTASGQFLKLAVGARAIGLGEAYGPVADDATAVYWNPAGLTQLDGRSATVMHAAYLQDIFYDFIGYGQKWGDGLAFGAGVQYLNGGSVAQTDISGFEQGYFHPNDLSVAASIATELTGAEAGFLEGTALGITGKYVRSQLVATAETGAIDVGLLSPRLLEDHLRFSAGAQNLMGRLKFDQEDEPLPVTYRAGLSLRLGGILLAGEGVAPIDDQAYVAGGAEWVFHPDYEARYGVALRAGWNSRRSAGLNESLAGWSFGAGYVGPTVRLDYAFTPFGNLGTSNRASVSFRF